MLELRNISKEYRTGAETVKALRGVSLAFRESEFVSVLGPSGCGNSGISKGERRRRAVEALQQVGLGDQINKKPAEMSGGQVQRVAIARALINDPDIILADEPTGALDTETSTQVMDILKDISARKLVIMVTHNPELAERYSTRIVRLSDGQINISGTA